MTDFDERHGQLVRVAFERSYLLQNPFFRIEYELTLTRFCNHEMRNCIACDFWDFPQNQ